jgi:hypothetical protein
MESTFKIQHMNHINNHISILKILFLFIATGMWSCTDELESNILLQGQRKQLVVNGHITENKPMYVSVTNNIFVGTPVFSLRNINTGLVEFFEDGIFLGKGTYTPVFRPVFPIQEEPEQENPEPAYGDPRAFYILDHLAKPGKTYTVRVSVPGYPDATAEDIIPTLTATIGSLRILGRDRQRNEHRVEIEINRLDGGEGFYHLLFYSKPKETEFLFDVGIIKDESSLVDTDVNGIIFPPIGINGMLLSQNVFPETTRTFSLSLSTFFVTEGFDYEIFAELRTVSKTYHDYYLSVIRQYRASNDAFAQPAPVFNNIKGGVGNFSGYSSVFTPPVTLF